METVMTISTKPIGRSGLSTTTLSFGGAVIGNLFKEVSDEDALGALQAAWDAGVRYFDTAPHYGLGLSERRHGEFLADKDRGSYVLSTKVGRLIRPNPQFHGGLDDQGFAVSAKNHRVLDYSREGVLTSLEESLERLAGDSIDVVFVHDPDDYEHEALEGAFVALEELRGQGVIRSYGAGMNQSAMLARFVDNTDLDVVMCAGRFSLLDQSAAEDLLPRAAKRGVSVVAAGVFNSGILATETPPAKAHYDYAPASQELLERARALSTVCQELGYSLPQVAAQFPLLHPAVKSVCLGARSAEQSARNAALFDTEVPARVYAELVHRGLLNPGVLDY